jgi:hypothetical protein
VPGRSALEVLSDTKSVWNLQTKLHINPAIQAERRNTSQDRLSKNSEGQSYRARRHARGSGLRKLKRWRRGPCMPTGPTRPTPL